MMEGIRGDHRKEGGPVMNLIQTYYAVLFALSFLVTLIYVYQWQKHFDVNMTVVFVLIPVTNLSFYLMSCCSDPDTAIFALKIIYIGGCFLPWLITMCVASLCRITVRRRVRVVTFLLSSAMYGCVLTIGHLPLYYRSLTMEKVGGVWVAQKVYGPLHKVFYACILLYLAANLAVVIYSYSKKKQVSGRVLNLLFIPSLASMIGYFFNSAVRSCGIEIVPVSYLIAQIFYLLIAHRMTLYDVSDMVIESMVQSGDTGFITVDFKHHYLGSNGTAKSILPELRRLNIDQSILQAEGLRTSVLAWLDQFKEDPMAVRSLYVRRDPDGGEEDRFYTVNVNYLYDGRRRRGYQIFLEDDTHNQKYIRLLDKYNSELQDEVAAKTARIVEMHDNLVLGMATMVERRDNSTGGHIRRTSEGVRLLIEAMRKDEALSDEFCRNIIKAAPMHDLGKIAVDDAILRKPGRYTPEEYDQMKVHAAEGARIVHEILKDTDDDSFRHIAENVAHYHHERVDGSGYPEGLRGDEIPLEARIMAIADVYDALVSKRVYKAEFSFEAANRIILDGMGRQFDQKLQAYYEAARPRLEAYYSAESGRSG